jgi:hypothetical protein
MRQRPPRKIDLRAQFKTHYTAAWRIQDLVVGKGVFLMLDGDGEPGGRSFQQAIEKVYSVAYTLRFSLKRQGVIDFGVSCLECLYLTSDPCATPRSEWRWSFLLRIPEAVTARQVATARAEVRRRRDLDTRGVRRRVFREGRCIQALHIGPYAQVGASYDRLEAFARERGLAVSCPAHEIYISDPRRTPKARLKTIVRLSVRRARA